MILRHLFDKIIKPSSLISMVFLLLSGIFQPIESRRNANPFPLQAKRTKIEYKRFEKEETNLETLKMVQVFFRHGDRSPLTDFPLNPENFTKHWPLGTGQLTLKGKSQANELGSYLRRRYDRFINSGYDPREIFAQSSDTDRSIMSALCVLEGLYPKVGPDQVKWDPVPLRTIPRCDDNKLAFSAKCPAYSKEMEHFINVGGGRAFNEQFKEYYEFLKCKTGHSCINYDVVLDIYDTLYIQALYKIPLPDWSISKVPSGDSSLPAESYRMKQIALFAFEALLHNKKAKRLRGGPILQEVMGNIDAYMLMNNASSCSSNKANNNNDNAEECYGRNRLRVKGKPVKMQLYSGHDTTLAAVLSVLDAYDENSFIPYSAAVIIELHAIKMESSNPEDYFIKVFYRNCTKGPLVEITVPDCECQGCCSKDEKMCTVDSFRRSRAPYLAGSWDLECKFDRSINSIWEAVIYYFKLLIFNSGLAGTFPSCKTCRVNSF